MCVCNLFCIECESLVDNELERAAAAPLNVSGPIVFWGVRNFPFFFLFLFAIFYFRIKDLF
jgi:hypothetical protein